MDIFNTFVIGADAALIFGSCRRIFRGKKPNVKAAAVCIASAALVIWLCFGISGAAEGALFTVLYVRFGYLPGFGATAIMTALPLAAAYLILKPIEKLALSGVSENGRLFPIIFAVLVFAVSLDITDRFGSTVDTDALPPVSVFVRALIVQGLCLAGLLSAAGFCLRTAREKAKRDSEKEYAEKAGELYRKTVSFRHDIKNHLTVVDGLIKKRDYGGAAEYAEKLCGESAALSFRCSTGVRAADALLERKLSEAEALGIRTDCTLKIPRETGIDDMDLCTVLSNAADNGINECTRLGGGFISLSGGIRSGMLFIVAENSCGDFENGGFTEGVGIKNIRAAVKKYGGTVQIENGGGTFRLTAAFCISRRCENISRPNH